ncbi:DUF1127 domain-containing protein [Thalassospira xianhensis]|uniref:YjiS-like domain-containing protein n=1 Tax=Thalassospira xianhensis MCCC 1A02616 TaxID=1177929 RepID=A0A367UEJ7_9PROT|nr:DUF1127 domain-containing protein [Thalassospira xianhensis]RCK06745.1 hypothetical protein TH5_06230 [Thalassospira xianhensis MCCC 1A02616]
MAHSVCQTPSGQHTTRHNHISGFQQFFGNLQQGLNTALNIIAATMAKRSQRRALMRLSDSQLADMGLSRTDAEAEYRKSYPI